MTRTRLDRVDKGVLYSLQRDARTTTTTEMGECMGVAGSTIRNRIDRLEADGVIEGYHAAVDYEAAGFPLYMHFSCSTPERSEDVVDEVLRQPGVVVVRELLAGTGNLHVEAVGTDTSDVTAVADGLRGLGLEVVRSDVVKRTHVRPFSRFRDGVDGSDASPGKT